MNQKYLQGLSSNMRGPGDAVCFEATAENIAAFLLQHQYAQMSAIGTMDDKSFLTAQMGFIDICPDQQYLAEKLLPIYSKAQMEIIPPPQLEIVSREQALAEACPAPDWNYLRWDGYSDRKYQAIRSGEGLLELEWDGKKVPLELQVRAYYCGGALALMLADWTSGEPEPWADLTVNLGGPGKKDCAFVDVNKLGQDILPWIKRNGLGSPTGRSQRSGFVVYPEYRFDSERLKELDDEGYRVYVQLLEKRREVKKTRGREG